MRKFLGFAAVFSSVVLLSGCSETIGGVAQTAAAMAQKSALTSAALKKRAEEDALVIEGSSELSASNSTTLQCANAESVRTSLEAMIKPMSRADQVNTIHSMFMISYASRKPGPDNRLIRVYSGRYSLGKDVKEKADRFTDAFLDDRRMDDYYEAVRTGKNLYGQTTSQKVIGHSSMASYNIFVDNFCSAVSGMDAPTLVKNAHDKNYLETVWANRT